jgi:hypothetical protein
MILRNDFSISKKAETEQRGGIPGRQRQARLRAVTKAGMRVVHDIAADNDAASAECRAGLMVKHSSTRQQRCDTHPDKCCQSVWCLHTLYTKCQRGRS